MVLLMIKSGEIPKNLANLHFGDQRQEVEKNSEEYKTTAFFMYDDDAVYVGAYLHHPGDIPMELSEER